MPWERRPAWMYLPHLDDEVHRAGGVNDRKRSYDTGGDGACAADGGREVRARRGDDEYQKGSASSSGAHSGTPPAAAHSAVQGVNVPILGQQPRDAAAGTGHPAATEIKGRDNLPGAEAATVAPDLRAAAVGRIRGHDLVPGPAGADALSRARQRLDARNSLLAQSLADHAERVDRRSREGSRTQQPTVAERMAAIRRRLAERQTAVGQGSAIDAPRGKAGGEAASSGGGGGASEVDGAFHLRTGTSGTDVRNDLGAPSKEDVKIHYVREEDAIGEVDAGVLSAHAPAAAASFVAWHSASTAAPAP